MERILALPDGTRLLILGPLVRDRKTEGDRVFEAARRQGFVRVRVDGELRDLDDVQTLDKYKRHTIEVVVDRLVVRHEDESGRPFDAEHPDPDAARLADSVETALRLGEGVVVVAPADPGAFEEQRYSEHYTCPFDGTAIEELEPRSFCFNSPHGACPACTGLGVRLEIDPERVVPDKGLSIAEGALLRPWARMPMADSWYGKVLEAVASAHGWDPTMPIARPAARGARAPPQRARAGSRCASPTSTTAASNTYVATFEGIIPNLERRYERPTPSSSRRSWRSSWSSGPARPAPAPAQARAPSRSPSTG